MSVLSLSAASAPSSPVGAVTDLPRAEQRSLLASTPPAPRFLVAHAFEDLAVRTLMYSPALVTRRLDDPARMSSDLPDEHYGAIRLFDRGIITLTELTDTHAAWRWVDLNAQADGLRLLRHRTLGFLPFNMGCRGKRPETMTGPELVALLVWYYRNTGVTRLDIARMSAFETLTVEHRADGTRSEFGTPLVWDLPGFFEKHASRVHPHLDRPDHIFDPVVVHAVLTHLCRVGAAEFGEEQVTVDLNTWHLRRFRTDPSTFTQMLPLEVQDALGVLGAPAFVGPDAFVAWAEKHLTVTVLCQTGAEAETRRGGRKHTLRLDPHTGRAVTMPSASPRQREELEAVHLLAALSGDPDLRCVRVQQAWQADGVLCDMGKVRWAEVQQDRVLAVHRVAEAARAFILDPKP